MGYTYLKDNIFYDFSALKIFKAYNIFNDKLYTINADRF